MSRHEEMCPHCRAKAGLNGAQQLPVEPITMPELPEQPRLFRVHYPDGHTRDHTLHPDGRMSMQASGQTLWSMLSFAFMVGTSWVGAHIEWDPEPPPAEPEHEPSPAAVQDAIPFP